MPTSKPAITPRKRPRRAAFTLAEIIVVVILAAALMAAAVGFYARGHHARNLDKSAHELLNTARYARVLAIEQQQTCQLLIERNQARFCLAREQFDQTQNAWLDTPIKNHFTRPTQLPSSIRFGRVHVNAQDPDRHSDPDRCCVEFGPAGECDGAIIELTNGQVKRTLVIAPATGQARLYTGEPKQTLGQVIDLDGL